MKISGDSRVLSHFYKDEKSAVYTIIYPPTHSLRERCDILDELVVDMKMALKQEEELKVEHGKYLEDGGKLEKFEEWFAEKQKKAQEEAKAKAEEVKDIPPAVEEAKIEDAIVEEVKK